MLSYRLNILIKTHCNGEALELKGAQNSYLLTAYKFRGIQKLSVIVPFKHDKEKINGTPIDLIGWIL
jgi:hypothetical protein